MSAQINCRYSKGATKFASPSLYARTIEYWPIVPINPIKIKIDKSGILGVTQIIGNVADENTTQNRVK